MFTFLFYIVSAQEHRSSMTLFRHSYDLQVQVILTEKLVTRHRHSFHRFREHPALQITTVPLVRPGSRCNKIYHDRLLGFYNGTDDINGNRLAE